MLKLYDHFVGYYDALIQNFPKLVPLSVALAVIVFVAREISDGIKKNSIDRRKRRALNALFLALCQRNLWVLRKVESASDQIDRAIKSGELVSINFEKDDRDFLDYRVNRLSGYSGGSIPPVHISLIEKNLLDAALLDKTYFDLIIKAHDSILDLDHLRSSLERHVKNWNNDVDRYVLEGYNPYVIDRAPHIKSNLEALGKACGGTLPLQPRVR